MGLFDSEAGKRRLLTVEIPVIERYNDGRDADYRVLIAKQGSGLVLAYRLKPMHNVYQMETRLLSTYPAVPPETRVLTPLKPCPHMLEGQTLCLWRQGSTRRPAAGTRGNSRACSPFKRPGLAGVLRGLVRHRRMAVARSQVI